MNLNSYLKPYPKINLKWIKDLTVRPKVEKKKNSEENIQKKLHWIGLGNDLLDMTPKAQATKLDKLSFFKILKVCASKDINRQLTSKGNSQNGKITYLLTSTIHTELLKWNNKKNNQSKKWIDSLQRRCVNKHMKKMLNIINH